MKHSTKYLRRLASLCCTAVLFLFSAAVPALAAVPERPANLYVLDSAGVLSEETEKKIREHGVPEGMPDCAGLILDLESGDEEEER